MQLNITQKIKKPKGLSHAPKSFKNIYQSLKLNHIKSNIPESEIRKSANQTSKNLRLNHDIPIYELSLNDCTIDISNSFKYIREVFDKLNKQQKNAVIYKMENGFKKVYFSCKNLTKQIN